MGIHIASAKASFQWNGKYATAIVPEQRNAVERFVGRLPKA
jgi:hypothetical protein